MNELSFSKNIGMNSNPVRVLYSFPHKLGADRICYTAWQQVAGIADAGADVLVCPGVLHKPLDRDVSVHPTLAWGRVRIPYRLLGRMAACNLHDTIVASRLKKIASTIDIVHTWPLGALKTLRMAARLGIPTVLERCNAHTRFAYEVVRQECDRIGVPLPRGHEHEYNAAILAKEEAEYLLADGILCPSDFVVRTFRDQGFAPEKLFRHIYGFDEKRFFCDPAPRDPKRGLTMISVGVCAVRKGLHFALEAWLKSPASNDGTFLIAGEFIPRYAEKLAPMLSHPSVKVLGHRNDVPELMRKSDILVLPSIEEGFGLVVTEAMASGCVPLISDACTDICKHMQNGMIHHVGDVETLTRQITQLHQDRVLLEKLRHASLQTIPEITWTAAGAKLLNVYRDVIAEHQREKSEPIVQALGT
jgi:glycosyltransferase involved in cell wall biosynthesis